MTNNLPVSLPTSQNGSIFDRPRDHPDLRAISPDRNSVMSSDTATSFDNSEEGFVKKPPSGMRRLTAVIPGVLKRPRLSESGSAFQRWKKKHRQPVHALLVYAIAATIAVTSVAVAHNVPYTLLSLVSSILAALLIYYILHLQSLIPTNSIEKTIASWGLSNYPTQASAKLPADFSRDIIPIPCHSHNDYWRRVPLYDALAAGCNSVEADVWLSGADLLVGHSQISLTKDRTLESLYIEPIISILLQRNTPGEVPNVNGTLSNTNSPGTTQMNGIFETSPQTPLTLLIDIKTDGASTFPALIDHLEPLRSHGWLTHFNGTAVVPGLITVVGTGNTPFDLLVANNTYRDIFFDAPLEDLWGDDPMPINDYVQVLMGEKYTAENSYYASVSFQKEIGDLWHGMLTPQQVLTIRGQVRGAQARGLKARYWDTPAWPVGRRDHVWDVLMKEGVGSLNVDDLEAAKERKWGG